MSQDGMPFIENNFSMTAEMYSFFIGIVVVLWQKSVPTKASFLIAMGPMRIVPQNNGNMPTSSSPSLKVIICKDLLRP